MPSRQMVRVAMLEAKRAARKAGIDSKVLPTVKCALIGRNLNPMLEDLLWHPWGATIGVPSDVTACYRSKQLSVATQGNRQGPHVLPVQSIA